MNRIVSVVVTSVSHTYSLPHWASVSWSSFDSSGSFGSLQDKEIVIRNMWNVSRPPGLFQPELSSVEPQTQFCLLIYEQGSRWADRLLVLRLKRSLNWSIDGTHYGVDRLSTGQPPNLTLEVDRSLIENRRRQSSVCAMELVPHLNLFQLSSMVESATSVNLDIYFILCVATRKIVREKQG